VSILTPEQIAKAGSEHAHQVALFAWAATMFNVYPELRLMFAIPNGGLRNKVTAANLKAEGVKSGVFDIFLPAPRSRWNGLFIELKVGNNKPTLEQIKFMNEIQDQGYGATVCWDWKKAAEVIQLYLNFK
jgi:hypothetical protein